MIYRRNFRTVFLISSLQKQSPGQMDGKIFGEEGRFLSVQKSKKTSNKIVSFSGKQKTAKCLRTLIINKEKREKCMTI